MPPDLPNLPNLPDLGQRSFAAELLDAPNIPREALWQNLRELDLINMRLGGYQTTLKGLKALLGPVSSRRWRIVDVGCGGGDTLARIAAWNRRQGYQLELVGLDLLPDCIAYAQHTHSPAAFAGASIEWLVGDYQSYREPCDLVISSLFCHHLDNLQLSAFVGWLRQQARFGYLINDLHRHPLAYYGIAALTRLLSGSELVRHDAPLSVWRGFQRAELQAVFAEHQLYPRIRWDWAFRWLITGHV